MQLNTSFKKKKQTLAGDGDSDSVVMQSGLDVRLLTSVTAEAERAHKAKAERAHKARVEAFEAPLFFIHKKMQICQGQFL